MKNIFILNYSLIIFLFFTLQVSVNHKIYAQKIQDTVKTVKKINFKVVPYINYNRSFGGMFGLIPMAMYKLNSKDTISPTSLSGVGGIYTTNKSWGFMGFSNWFFNENKWRIKTVLAVGNINSQYFVASSINDFVAYNAEDNMFFFEVDRKIYKNLYLGINYVYSKFNNTFDLDPPVKQKVELNGLGVALLWDNRDDIYYPYSGNMMNVKYTTYPDFMGNEDHSQLIKIQYNHYFSMRRAKDVLGLRLFTGLGLGDISFNKEIVLGGRDLRGYTQRKYRGKQLIAIQSEYRYNFNGKIGAVGFIGVGSVFNSSNGSNDDKFLPSIGAGFRYNAFESNHLNIGVDVAAGKNDWGINFRIGESF